MAPDTRGYLGSTMSQKNHFVSKWDTLFDKDSKEWIAFKPALGMHVYPCYSCRHMFYSRKSFQDHVNRRAILIKYNCPLCEEHDLKFYNRCAFHLHCRKHYSLEKGTIDLKNVELEPLPMGLAGFSKHPNVPYLYEVEEEYVTGNTFMNAQFYAPRAEDRGKDVISLTPSHLLINRLEPGGENQALSLKQIAVNIPKCQFIDMQTLNELRQQMQGSSDEEVDAPPEVKMECNDSVDEDQQASLSEGSLTIDMSQTSSPEMQDRLSTSSGSSQGTNKQTATQKPAGINGQLPEITLPVITKIETVEEPPPAVPSRKCPECGGKFGDDLKLHFLGDNRPSNESLRCDTCRLICPTLCSFMAHQRIHDRQPPFICPDCGESFSNVENLVSHMDDVCYHSAKSVRFRCPGRRCGKIFASEATFGPHFKQLHIDTIFQCDLCKEIFTAQIAGEHHIITHQDDKATLIRYFSCQTCQMEEMSAKDLKLHLEFHCKDLSRCLFIFMCKSCKCYFRSVLTMSAHVKNCKVQKTGLTRRMRPPNCTNPFMSSKYVSGECATCKNRIIYLRAKPSTLCSKCASKPMQPPPPKKITTLHVDKCICILCKKQIKFEERRQHQKECKYAHPHVYVEKLDVKQNDETSSSRSFSSSSDLDGSSDSISPRKNRSDSSDDARPKKRHRPSKSKKPEIENDLTAEEPIQFDGTYQCRLCDFKTIDRDEFHVHIKTHRHISTAYQCMECGECFVVKPSLVKHLLHYHNIYNSEQYFQENDCFDQGAVTKLAKVVKAPYLANDVNENQCKVCMKQFNTSDEHDKHFRIHGMAFLMKNSI